MPEDPRIDSAIADAAARLSKVSESPRLDAELLICQTLDVARSYLFAHPEDTLDPATAGRFEDLVARREDGVPMAYIHGSKEFWSLDLMVSPATLVPRPDTEILVQQALTLLPRDATLKVLDLGTGSGAIALAIATERPECRVTATDISVDALAVAKENARQLDIYNIEFVNGDWLQPLGLRQFDLVVSNPPYVRKDDPALALLAHEPVSALISGNDGLDAIRHLASECAAVVKKGGLLLLEHGADQASDVAELLASHDWSDIRCHKDLAGHPRVTQAARL